jgi:hypothetical protein
VSLLERVHRGKRLRPRKILLWGTKGIGKSTWATDAPDALVFRTEDGLDNIDCASMPLEPRPFASYNEVQDAFKLVYTEAHDFKWLVMDSADWLERLIWQHVCQQRQVACLEDVKGPFMAGYKLALGPWRETLEALDALRNDRNMGIILLAHATIEKFQNPEAETYDRYTPRLHKWASEIVQEWCDEVLFATYKMHTTVTDEGFGNKRARAIGSGERILRTTERPAHAGKNRIDGLPLELPLEWSEFAKYIPGA